MASRIPRKQRLVFKILKSLTFAVLGAFGVLVVQRFFLSFMPFQDFLGGNRLARN
jgi:hypothetical protein